ncbi:ABC transporter permease/substrate-binding protein [Sphingomonas sp. PR090111-T3T-6A]|uniref:ABC transporter permease/substrate-binding protein n=1 Tax=Sphingomonas sp. PR090111-T3T-6A TaxID=685778 RepID=UPI00037BA6D4|nr:glycine betaine ABC transporter substrate-binding protein [Sphingomonas sp. PR090111-T3T-6A]
MSELLAPLPGLAAHHLLLSAAALGLALVVALPLGFVAARRPRLAGAALGVAGVIQTIPGLALLALFYPLLLAIGHGVPALGFLPAWLALALYALLPILRNVVAGLRGLDPGVIEAADGLGMTAGQRLRLVEAPLAAPVVMAGIRTATVWTIGAATLATTVGAASLGNLIFSGLQTEDWSQVLAGCLASAALALVADALLALIERGLARRERWSLTVGSLGVATGLLLACAPLLGGGARPVVVGAKNFSEQFILARLIGARLEQAGYAVSYREGLGSAVALRALRQGDIDVYVDYSGTIWADSMHRTRPAPKPETLAGIADFLKPAALVGPLGFENAYALAMTRQGAARHHVTDLRTLAAAAPSLTLGADLEFLSRPEWRAVREAYGLRFAASRAYAPSFMYRALESGQADVISAFSSDGRIAADDLVVLPDPARALPGYDAILLVSPAHAGDARFLKAIRPLVGAIPVEAMRRANYMVDRDRDKASPEAAARWLAAQLEHR